MYIYIFMPSSILDRSCMYVYKEIWSLWQIHEIKKCRGKKNKHPGVLYLDISMVLCVQMHDCMCVKIYVYLTIKMVLTTKIVMALKYHLQIERERKIIERWEGDMDRINIVFFFLFFFYSYVYIYIT
jgi:hypothetical protein